MFSYWTYILIGNDQTGKTSFQKHLIAKLCGIDHQRLTRNRVSDITYPRMRRGVETLFTMNRSYQENLAEYKSVERYFEKYFKDAHICILSSHTTNPAIDHLRDMIRALRFRANNVAAVFFSNGYDDNAKQISLLDWDERFWLDNPVVESEERIQAQIARLANEFVHVLVARGGHN